MKLCIKRGNMFRTLLICGSRKVIPEMLDRAFDLVTKAKANGYFIICGDAAGIDSAVMVKACELGILKKVYGITPEPRNICCDKHRAIYQQVPGNYLARDRYMVNMADRVIGLCLNKSPGTMYTCRYASDTGKPFGRIDWTMNPEDRHEVFGVR